MAKKGGAAAAGVPAKKGGALNPHKTVLPPKAGGGKSVVAQNILWRDRIKTEVRRALCAGAVRRSLIDHALLTPRPRHLRSLS